MRSKRLTAGLFSFLVLMAICRAQPALRLFEVVEPHMGTLVQIKLYAASETQATSAARRAFARIASLDETLSDYKPDSELNRVCRAASYGPVRVSADLFRVLAAAQRLAAQTEGAFDVTVGPLTHLWREARRTHRLPDAKAIDKATRRCGFRKLILDESKQTVKLAQSNMQLDVGGIGKGYAADEAIEVLRGENIQQALVSVSGDLVFSDAPPGQMGWRIGVNSYAKSGAPQEKVLFLKDGAASTSGDSEQHLDVGAVRYSHIIDPHTGMALTQPGSATVIARHGIDADGQATAVVVLGLERGMNFIERTGGSATLIVIKNPNSVEVRESSRFKLLDGINAAP